MNRSPVNIDKLSILELKIVRQGIFDKIKEIENFPKESERKKKWLEILNTGYIQVSSTIQFIESFKETLEELREYEYTLLEEKRQLSINTNYF